VRQGLISVGEHGIFNQPFFGGSDSSVNGKGSTPIVGHEDNNIELIIETRVRIDKRNADTVNNSNEVVGYEKNIRKGHHQLNIALKNEAFCPESGALVGNFSEANKGTFTGNGLELNESVKVFWSFNERQVIGPLRILFEVSRRKRWLCVAGGLFQMHCFSVQKAGK